MKKLRWQLLIALGGLILIAGLLFGQMPGAEVTAPQPVRGGIYVEADVGTPVRLNPVLDSYNQIDRDLDRLIYSGLIRFDSRGLPKADLAASWAVSADGKTYTFAIRPDAIWHDGQPVSSDDVIYTFSKLQDPDYPGPADLHEMWKQIKVEKLDDRSVQFTLPEPYAPFLDYLSLGLLPEHLLRGVSAKALIDHPYNLHPIGTGPFRFDRFVTDGARITAISLAAFDKYYGEHPYLQGVEMRFYADFKGALDAFQAGQVQGLGRASEAELPPLLQDPKVSTYSARLPSAGIVFLNLKNPEKTFLADKLVRQALLLSINRQALIDRFLGGQASVAVGPILPGSWAFAAGLEPTRYDPDRAANQLTAAGYVLPAGAAPGSPEYVRAKAKLSLAFELAHADDPTHTSVAKAIQANWALIGVQVTLKPVSADTLLKGVLEPRQIRSCADRPQSVALPRPGSVSLLARLPGRHRPELLRVRRSQYQHLARGGPHQPGHQPTDRVVPQLPTPLLGPGAVAVALLPGVHIRGRRAGSGDHRRPDGRPQRSLRIHRTMVFDRPQGGHCVFDDADAVAPHPAWYNAAPLVPKAQSHSQEGAEVEVAERPAGRVALATLQPGMEFQGKVTKIELFGAFVDIGAERDGLVHISMLRKERVNRVEDVVTVGQEVQVWVQSVDPTSHRLELTMIRPVLLKWKDIKPGLRVKGTVVKIEKFGAFVDVGAERPGLVHVSEMSDDYVTDPTDIVKEGDQVEAVVIDSDRSKRQIRLSMKQAAVLPAEGGGRSGAASSLAMEFALRQAMDGSEGRRPRRRRPPRRPARSTRKTQEEILGPDPEGTHQVAGEPRFLQRSPRQEKEKGAQLVQA